MTLLEIAERYGVSEKTARRKMAAYEPKGLIWTDNRHQARDYRVNDVKAAFKGKTKA